MSPTGNTHHRRAVTRRRAALPGFRSARSRRHYRLLVDSQPQPSPSGQPPRAARGPNWILPLLIAAGVAAFWSLQQGERAAAPPIVDYSVVYGWVGDGAVESVELRGPAVTGTLARKLEWSGQQIDRFATTVPPADESWLPLLHDRGVRIRALSEEPSTATRLLAGALPWVLIIALWLWLSRRATSMLGAGRGSMLARMAGARGKRFEARAGETQKFDDVAGLREAKQDLQEVVAFLKEPERFKKLGARVPRGVLLVGPPGTGKTLLARAVAGEAGVPFFSISGAEFIELFVGVGASRVRELFAEAKRNAPAILFIDEIDAVGRSRGAGMGGGHDEREQTLNQLLSEMDGFERDALTVVLAATNRPDVLDPALLRPGRFDRHVMVDRPEVGAREAILKVHARGKPLAPDVDLRTLAESTAGFVGADLANLVNEAALGAGRRGAQQITATDFLAAYDKVVLGNPRDTKLDASEKRRVAVHEAGHAVVAWFTPEAEPPRRVSIIPRGMSLGVTHQVPLEDRHLATRRQLEAKLDVLLAGYAAEQLVYSDVSTGAQSDLERGSALAAKMVANYGMSAAIGPAYYQHHAEHPFLGQRLATDSGVSEATLQLIDSEARALLAAALERARELLSEHTAALEQLIEELDRAESVEQERLRALLGEAAHRPPPPASEHTLHAR